MFRHRKITETTTTPAAGAALSMGEQLKARLLAQRRKKLKRKAAEHKGSSLLLCYWDCFLFVAKLAFMLLIIICSNVRTHTFTLEHASHMCVTPTLTQAFSYAHKHAHFHTSCTCAYAMHAHTLICTRAPQAFH